MTEPKTCKYDGCNEPVNSPHDEEFCVFHASVENKGISVEEFNNKIFERIDDIFKHNKHEQNDKDKKYFDFEGFIFPGNIDFGDYERIYNSKLNFNHHAYFTNAQFSGDASFINVQFSEDADFLGAIFLKRVYFIGDIFSGNSYFINAQFSRDAIFRNAQFSRDADFTNAQFSGDAYFKNAQFSGDASFSDAQFSGDADFMNAQFPGDADFSKAQFSKYAYFINAQFPGDASFWNAQFSGNAYFSNAQFSGDAYFHQTHFDGTILSNDLTIEKKISFANITMSDKARFYLRNPIFKPAGYVSPKIIFDSIQFNPFAVYFGDINSNDNINACLLFRYCQLKDVYFTNNDMSLFSFYKSSFDEARFISSKWGLVNDRILCFPFKRQNIIPEEHFLKQVNELNDNEEQTKQLRKAYKIEDLNSPLDIASLYRRMKTALDNTKDYEQSGWFYFNELEMKRQALEDEIETSEPKWKIFRWQPFIWLNQQRKKLFSRYILYFSYKVFTGFGQKPMWSFCWFMFFTVFFSFIHLLTGLRNEASGIEDIKYSLSSLYGSLANGYFWSDFLDSFIYTISRVLPVSYVSTSPSDCYPLTSLGKIASVFNSVILIILIIFIGIGLKRHFRRF